MSKIKIENVKSKKNFYENYLTIHSKSFHKARHSSEPLKQLCDTYQNQKVQPDKNFNQPAQQSKLNWPS